MIREIFTFFCVLGTAVMIWHCLHNYMKDGDVSSIQFRRFNEDEDAVAPSISLCFNDVFLENKLQEIGEAINSITYRSFLQGKTQDNRMAQIDYDNVTIDMNNYLDRIKFFTEKGNVHTFNAKYAKCSLLRSKFNTKYGLNSFSDPLDWF